MTTRGFSLVGLAALAVALGGCMNGAPGAELDNEAIGSAPQAIKGGTPATGFAEAVLVDILSNGQLSMGCSGSVIAPRVVLTAAHCVADGDEWQITAPYASGQKAHSTSSATYDWTQHNDQVSPDEHDVALIFLDSPITLTTYPTIATAPLPDQSEIITVGRVKGGQMSKTALYQSAPGKVHSAASYGFNYDYAAPMVLEPGDSGGPAFARNTHTIVSVNSTGDSSTQIIARVDVLADWIKQQIASHSGDPNGGGQGGGDPGGGQGGSDQGGGQGGSDPGGGQGGGPGGWPPGGGPGGGWPPGGGPGGGGQHCVFVPWMWSYYCW